MIEKIKTGLLIALIAISFRFTALYFARVHASAPLLVVPGPAFVEEPQAEIPESYIDLFRPHYMLIHNRNEHYRVGLNEEQYDSLWEALKEAVGEAKNSGQATDPELIPVKSVEWQRLSKLSYEYRFAGPIQLHYWWLTASKATLQKFPEEVYFNRLLIPLDEATIYLQNTFTTQVWKWQWVDEANASLFPTLNRLHLTEEQRVREVRLAKEIALVPGSQLYVPAVHTTLPEILAATPITNANKADIVKRFFSITPRMHKTEAQGGGVVAESYITARQQVLTLHNTGMLQYSEKPAELAAGAPGSTTIEQFEQAFNFVLARGGWPKGAVSAGMQPIREAEEIGYRFGFVQLYNGLPVIDFVPTMDIEVVPGGVQRYQRLTYDIIQPGYFQFEVRSAEDALARATSAIGDRKVNDVYLAYYQRPYYLSDAAPFHAEPMYLYPVWAIELENGERLFVHAYKLLNDPGLIKP